jgi:hypothetical protein
MIALQHLSVHSWEIKVDRVGQLRGTERYRHECVFCDEDARWSALHKADELKCESEEHRFSWPNSHAFPLWDTTISSVAPEILNNFLSIGFHSWRDFLIVNQMVGGLRRFESLHAICRPIGFEDVLLTVWLFECFWILSKWTFLLSSRRRSCVSAKSPSEIRYTAIGRFNQIQEWR